MDMMTKISLVIFIATIMVVGVLGTNYVSDADALKSKNGTSGSTDICRLILCSDYPGGKAAYQDSWSTAFRSSTSVPINDHPDNHSEGHSMSKITPSSHNVDQEFPAQLDVLIHKFELDKISSNEAMNGLTGVYDDFVGLTIESDIIEDVGEKIVLYNSGKLEAADAVEAIHLTAEPQNVDPEFINAVEEYTCQLELNDISLNEAFEGITDVYDGFVGLTIISELIEDVGTQLAVYDSGRVSKEFTLEEIEEIIEEAERAAQESYSEGGITEMKELPPNTVDIPAGTGVPGCEVDDWCYMPSSLTAHVGDTVTWINSDTLPHTVTSGNADADAVGLDVPNGFDSGFMSTDDRFEHTFDITGFYDYYCQLHPWMIGSITIE